MRCLTNPRLLSLAVMLAGGVIGAGGCASSTSKAPAIPPPPSIDTFAGRTLDDEGLRNFLRQNLGREPGEIWDFETLSWVAFYYQPSLSVARAQWEEAKAARVTAAARPNPVLGLTPGYSTNAPAGTSPWFPSINLDFLFATDRKREKRAAVGQFAADAAELDVAAAVWQVRGELRQALIDFSAAEKRASLLAAPAELQQQLLLLEQQRLEAGAVAAAEIAPARFVLIRSQAAAAEAKRQVPLARQRVAHALGLPPAAIEGRRFDAASAETVVLQPAVAALRADALQKRADVLAALARYESAHAALRLELAGRYPDVQLGPGFQWDQGQDKWSLALSFELPIFNRHEGPIAAAVARVKEAGARLLAVQADVIAAIDGAAAERAAALEQLAHLRQVQDGLDKQLALAQARLAAGNADRVEWLNAKIDSATTALAVFDATTAVARATGRLKDALQVPFSRLNAAVRSDAQNSPSLP